MLSLVIAMRLYDLHPQAQEGDLSRMRARLVRGSTLTEVATSINLGQEIKLGEGELKSGGFRRASILADAFEALLGAIFIDGGYEACRRVVLSLFDPLIAATARGRRTQGPENPAAGVAAGTRPCPAAVLAGRRGGRRSRQEIPCHLPAD